MPTLTTQKAIQLSELTHRIERTLTQAFSGDAFWVIADLSNHTFQPNYSRHFLDLVEKDELIKTVIAKVSAVAWTSGAERIRHFEKATGQRFTSGIKVCVKVQVDFHAAYGLKLVILDVDPSFTLGQLELHRQATIQKLLKECPSFIKQVGDRLQTINNSLSHATVIQRIAVLSSSTSAGLQDFRSALLHNRYGFNFAVNYYFTPVQGDGNTDIAVKKLEEICATKKKFDAVVIIRGGGADTDLLLFDQYDLCKAVARLHIPVITGIGHLKNKSIVDMLAHSALATPTKCAEFIIAHNLAFETLLLVEQKKVVIKAQQILAQRRQELLARNSQLTSKAKTLLAGTWQEQAKIAERIKASSTLILHRQRLLLSDTANKAVNTPLVVLSSQRQEVQAAREAVMTGTRNFLKREESDLVKYETIWRLMSPVNLLQRGFALVYHNGKIITDAKVLQAGDNIVIRMQDADLSTTITTKRQNDGNDTFEL